MTLATLLAKQNIFTVSLHQEYHIDAATWIIHHASWELPLQLTGVYRNPLTSLGHTGAEAYTNRMDTETGQLAAIEEIADTMQLTSGPAVTK